jgi:hypothetical protein
VLLGEVKWSARPFDRKSLEAALRELAAKPAPPLPSRLAEAELLRALFVPEIASRPGAKVGHGREVMLITAADLGRG